MKSKKFGFGAPEVLALKIRLFAKQNGYTLSELFRAACRAFISPGVYRSAAIHESNLRPPPPPSIRNELDRWKVKNSMLVVDFKKELKQRMEEIRGKKK
jgi:hypothetical protein